MIESTIGAEFMPLNVADFIGARRIRAVIKKRPCDFQVEEVRENFQTTFSGECDLPPNLPVYEDGLVALTLLCDRLTTAGGIEKMRELLDIPSHVEISAGGLKDRWAWTSQETRLKVRDMKKLLAKLAAQGGFERAMRTYGIYVKDPRSAKEHLGKGHLEGNRFTIRVDVEGAPKVVLQSYMEAAMEKAQSMMNNPSFAAVALSMGLEKGDILVPNAYGNQRQGARQNLAKVGEDLIYFGAEAAFKRFLIETTSNEGHRARDLRKKLARVWNDAVEAIAAQRKQAQDSGDVAEIERTSKLSVVNMRTYIQDMLEILQAPDRFAQNKRSFEVCNMWYEWKLVQAMFRHLDCEAVLRDPRVRDDLSLWVGAYQGYHFNQLLAKTIDGTIPLEMLIEELKPLTELHAESPRVRRSIEKRNLPRMEVPLFSCEPVALAFYQRFMPEAIPAQIDPLVRELFLCPGSNGKGPWRPPYVVPKGLRWEVEENAVNFRFTLRSGAYATTFLGLLFYLVEAKRENKGNRNDNKQRNGNRR